MSNNKLSVEDLQSLGITVAWANFISFAKTQCPHGHIDIRIVNGEPNKLIKFERDIRFDKVDTIPKVDFEP